MSDKPIAFFDSGVGGLSVLSDALHLLPEENYIYFADTDNVPYGTKSSDEIQSLVRDTVHFLSTQNLKALVIACNTATSVVVRELRQTYDFPIVGMEPAVKPATELGADMRVLVCATDRTIEEDKLMHLIHNLEAEDRVDLCSLQELVTSAENFDFFSNEIVAYIKDKLAAIDWLDYSAIVLGCTHFIYYRNILRSIIPDHVFIIDGNMGTVRRLAAVIGKEIDKHWDNQSRKLQSDLSERYSRVRYYQSGREVPAIYYDNYLRFIEEIRL